MFWTIGCLYGASSVALGAFGAHGLKKRIADPSKMANWNTAAHYQVGSGLQMTGGSCCTVMDLVAMHGRSIY